MKLLLLFIVLFSGFNCYAQVTEEMLKEGLKGNVRLVETEWRTSDAPEMPSTVSFFDKGGRIVYAIGKERDGVSSRMVFKYNNEKQLVEIIQNASDKLKYTYANTCNSAGQLIKQVVYGTGDFRPRVYTFKYDKSGRIIELVKNERRIDIWPTVCRYSYDKAGRKIAEYTYNQYGYLIEKLMFDYNDQGDIVKRSRYELNDTVKVKYGYFSYTYDNHNNWITRKFSDGQGEEPPGSYQSREIKYY